MCRNLQRQLAARRCSKSVSSTDFILGYLERDRSGLLIAAISSGAPTSTIAPTAHDRDVIRFVSGAKSPGSNYQNYP
jgi:hypothetical protein